MFNSGDLSVGGYARAISFAHLTTMQIEWDGCFCSTAVLYGVRSVMVDSKQFLSGIYSGNARVHCVAGRFNGGFHRVFVTSGGFLDEFRRHEA
jgi:hypothetical protein